MKFFSFAAILTLLAVIAVASAAPAATQPTTPIATFEDVVSVNKNKIIEKIELWWAKVKCMHNAVEAVLENTRFGKVLKEKQLELAYVITIGWVKCEFMMNKAQKLKCQWINVKKGVVILSKFYKALHQDFKDNLVNKLRKNVDRRCFPKSRSTKMFLFSDVVVEVQNLAEDGQCIVDEFGAVFAEFGMEADWSEIESELQNTLDVWQQCESLGSRAAVWLCSAEQTFEVRETLDTYAETLYAENPQALARIAPKIQERCTEMRE